MVTNKFAQKFSIPVYHNEQAVYTQLLWEVGVRGIISDMKGVVMNDVNVFQLGAIYSIVRDKLDLNDNQIKERIKMLEYTFYIKNVGSNFHDSVWILRIRDNNGNSMSWQQIKDSFYDLGFKESMHQEAAKKISSE